jgi:NADH-quinone oxidoreductase subunit E
MTVQAAEIENDATKETIRDSLEHHPDKRRDSLIPILQKVQDKLGFLSREAVVEIGNALQLPASKIYGVATFYNQFRFEPLGRYHIQICRGTACHVKGSALILERLTRELDIEPGQTSRDGMFSLEVVACIGACGLAPVFSINGAFHAKLSSDDVPGILDNYRKTAVEDN